jgi:hypothetical protein
MMTNSRLPVWIAAGMVALVVLAGCGTSSSGGSSPTATPAAKRAGGDIPDTAVYLTYQGNGYSLKYVEGWGIQIGSGGTVSINDKDSSETVAFRSGGSVATTAATDIAHLRQTVPSFQLVSRTTVKLAPGMAVHAQYRSLSPSDPVTGKRVAILVDRYYIPGPKKLAILTLATPVGVDNIDAFRLIAQSFRWV